MMPGKRGFLSRIRRMRFCRISSFTETTRAPDFLRSPTVLIIVLALFVRGSLLALGKAEGDDLVRDEEGREFVDHEHQVVGVRLLQDAHPRLGVLRGPDLDLAAEILS